MEYSKINDMDRQEIQNTMQVVGMLTEPLTRRIMAKLASKHSPIAANDVPTDLLKASKPQIISRLSRLERFGLVRSERKTVSAGFCKEYRINDSGKRWVHDYMTTEFSEFQSQ